MLTVQGSCILTLLRAPMRTLVHVSDLHFGRADQAVVSALLTTWARLRPDLVIVSGDLTQRAAPHEFEDARAFLHSLSQAGLKYLVIPGNHDIAPVYRPLERLRAAYKNYQTYISEHTEPLYHDGEVAIACINTVQRAQLYNGRINAAQLRKAQEWFSTHRDSLKIVVTHHPLRPNPKRAGRLACVRGGYAHKKLTGFDVDMFLSGHHHHSHVERPRALDVHAGTVSERLKGEPPSFNVIAVDDKRIAIHTHCWEGGSCTFQHKTTVNVPRTKRAPAPTRITKGIKRIRGLVRRK